MTIVTEWHDLVDEIVAKFPEICPREVMLKAGDMPALMAHIAARHELTLAEAAEVVTFRLPHFIEREPLSA